MLKGGVAHLYADPLQAALRHLGPNRVRLLANPVLEDLPCRANRDLR
jgi:hypothetical protein